MADMEGVVDVEKLVTKSLALVYDHFTKAVGLGAVLVRSEGYPVDVAVEVLVSVEGLVEKLEAIGRSIFEENERRRACAT